MITNYNPNQESSASQNDRIKAALEQGDVITPLDALRRFGCFRLGARIWDLTHNCGMQIKREWLKLPNGKKVMSYRLQADGAAN